MCGIFGTYHNTHLDTQQADIVWGMLNAGVVRGVDGTGFMVVNKKNELSYLKCEGMPYNMYDARSQINKQWNDLEKTYKTDGIIVVGHHRAATKGIVNARNAHPFQHGHITLVHNGTLHGGFTLEAGIEVDSHAITKMVAELGQSEAFSTIRGAYTCVWWDDTQKALKFIKNGERPFSVARAQGNLYWASEANMLQWLILRHHVGIQAKDIDWIKMENDCVYTMGVTDKGQVSLFMEEKITKKAPPPVTFTPYGGWDGAYETKKVYYPAKTAKPHKDFMADFSLLSCQETEHKTGTVYKYVGVTDQGEGVFVYLNYCLGAIEDRLWTAVLQPGHRVNGNHWITKDATTDATFYQIDSTTLTEIVEDPIEAGVQSKVFATTLDGRDFSKNLAKKMTRKGCIQCNEILDIRDVGKMISYVSAENKILGLYCKACVTQFSQAMEARRKRDEAEQALIDKQDQEMEAAIRNQGL